MFPQENHPGWILILLRKTNKMTDSLSENIKCCLWNASKIDRHDLSRTLIPVEIIDHESHFTRKILKCKECGQIFLYQFNEDVDWIDGNDDQYYKWIPVENIEKARELYSESEDSLDKGRCDSLLSDIQSEINSNFS